MRTRKRGRLAQSIYLSLSALLFCAGVSIGEQIPWFGIGLVLVAVVNCAVGIAEVRDYRKKLADDDITQRAMQRMMSPELEMERVGVEHLRELQGFMKLVKAMSPDQIKYASMMAPAMFEYVDEAMSEKGKRYSKHHVKLVIHLMSEAQYGMIWLPTQHNLPSGSRVQNIVRAITDDLLVMGLAQREKKNSRAFLTVGRDEAYEALTGERSG